MKSHSLFVLLFGLCSLKTTQAQEPTRFHLDLNRPPPQAGDESERTIQIFSTICSTNLTRGQESVTNSFHFLELKGREKILNWDASNDWSKVEMAVDDFVDGDGQHTNELVKPGTQLIGTSILGESFFQSDGGTVPADVYRQLEMSYNIRPHSFDEFARTRIPPLVSAGESWVIPPPTNTDQLAGVFGTSFANHVRAVAQFVGTTNLFGFDCFHLQFRITSDDYPEALRKIITARLPVTLKGRAGLTMDLIVPFDESQRILSKHYFWDFSSSSDMVVDGTNALSSRGRTTLDILSESRPVMHQ